MFYISAIVIFLTLLLTLLREVAQRRVWQRPLMLGTVFYGVVTNYVAAFL